VVAYEALLGDPIVTYGAIAAFLGLATITPQGDGGGRSGGVGLEGLAVDVAAVAGATDAASMRALERAGRLPGGLKGRPKVRDAGGGSSSEGEVTRDDEGAVGGKGSGERRGGGGRRALAFAAAPLRPNPSALWRSRRRRRRLSPGSSAGESSGGVDSSGPPSRGMAGVVAADWAKSERELGAEAVRWARAVMADVLPGELQAAWL
jgi:hypothetical protein